MKKIFKVTQAQLKKLQSGESITAADGTAYSYETGNDVAYIVVDPSNPEYRLAQSGDAIQLTKDGNVVSDLGVSYADRSGYSTYSHTLVYPDTDNATKTFNLNDGGQVGGTTLFKALQCDSSASSDNDVITKKDVSFYSKTLSWSSQVTVGSIAGKSIILKLPSTGSITCSNLTAYSTYAGASTSDTTDHTYFTANAQAYTTSAAGIVVSTYKDNYVATITGNAANGGCITLKKYKQYTSTTTSSAGLSTTKYTINPDTIQIGLTGIKRTIYTNATSNSTSSFSWPTSGGTIMVGSTAATVFKSIYLDLNTLSYGIAWGSAGYYTTNMECGSESVTLGTSTGSEVLATISFHDGSKGNGTWHVFINVRDSKSGSGWGSSIGVSAFNINNSGFSYSLRRVAGSSSASTSYYFDWFAVKYW